MAFSRTHDSDLASQARAFEAIAWLALALLALNLLRLVGIVSLGFALADGIAAGDIASARPELERFLRSLVEILPTLIYLGGVWSARKMFARIGRGELFSDANSRSLSDVGSSLMWGALTAMVLVPQILAWIDGERGIGGVRIEQETLVLAIIGAGLALLGRMMVHATRLQSELSEII